MFKVNLYTDGACKGNPGPGGCAAIIVCKSAAGKTASKEIVRGYRNTTNNRMELLAVILGLEELNQPCEVTVTSDSKYVLDGITKWIKNWVANDWKTSSKKPVKNKELWQRLLIQQERHQITFHWVKGHNGHPQNERCDTLAVQGSNHPTFTDNGTDMR